MQQRIKVSVSWPGPGFPSKAHCSARRGEGMLCLPSQGSHCILERVTYLIPVVINVVSEA